MAYGSIAIQEKSLKGNLTSQDIEIAVDRLFSNEELDEHWMISIFVENLGENEYSASVDVEDDEFDLQINTSISDTREEQLQSLYHELQHIRQYVQGRNPFERAHRSQEAYLNDPLEIEAREYENYEHDHHNYL